ncbi:hypothetical protein ZWY2020_019052 [Hordeum vulgare]|nr:hypothetical protein ZWY2020_019052 [Hordeum vulgare]
MARTTTRVCLLLLLLVSTATATARVQHREMAEEGTSPAADSAPARSPEWPPRLPHRHGPHREGYRQERPPGPGARGESSLAIFLPFAVNKKMRSRIAGMLFD